MTNPASMIHKDKEAFSCIQEIVSIADRVLVLSNGLKTGEFSGDEIKEDTLVLASYKGHHVQNHEKEN